MYTEQSKSCQLCASQSISCQHPLPTFGWKLLEMKHQQSRRPLIIIMLLFFLCQFSGMYASQSYLVPILKAYKSPLPPDQFLAIMTLTDTLANIIYICMLRFFGKRHLFLTLIGGVFVCTLVLATFGFIFVPSGYNLFDKIQEQNFMFENEYLAYVPLVCLFMWSFCSQCGFYALPWNLLSELFPYK